MTRAALWWLPRISARNRDTSAKPSHAMVESCCALVLKGTANPGVCGGQRSGELTDSSDCGYRVWTQRLQQVTPGTSDTNPLRSDTHASAAKKRRQITGHVIMSGYKLYGEHSIWTLTCMDTSCMENIQSGLLLVWIQVVWRTFNLDSYLYGYKLYGEHSIWTLTCMDTSCMENIQSELLLVWIQVVWRTFNLDSYLYGYKLYGEHSI